MPTTEDQLADLQEVVRDVLLAIARGVDPAAPLERLREVYEDQVAPVAA